MTGQAGLRACASGLDDVTARVLEALSGLGGTSVLRGFLDAADDQATALAALRVAGADVLAPQAFGVPLEPGEAEVAAAALAAFRPTGDDMAVIHWRDWAFAALLARHSEAVPRPPTPAPHPAIAALDGTPGGWLRASAALAQLSPLAMPGLDGPVHEAVRRAPLAVARGATRAILRRDYATAARLTRWLAFLHRAEVPLPLDCAHMIDAVAVHAAPSPRLALDLSVADLLAGSAHRPTEAGR
jgi:hypothetical protein